MIKREIRSVTANLAMSLILLYPFHALLVGNLGVPNYWRQAAAYLFFFLFLVKSLINNRLKLGYVEKDVAVIVYIYMVINTIGVVVGLFKGIPLDIIENSFLLSVGFLPVVPVLYFIRLKINTYVNLFYCSSLIIAIGALYEQVTGNHVVSQEYQSLNNILSATGVYRVGSFFGDALTLGPFLAFSFIIGIYKVKFLNYYLRIVCQVIIVAGIVFSGVRSAYVILLLGVLLSLILNIDVKKLNKYSLINGYFAVFLLLITLSIVFSVSSGYGESFNRFFDIQQERVSNIFNVKADAGNVGRVDNYNRVLIEVSSSLEASLFGVGYGLSTNYNPGIVNKSSQGFSAENQYLKVLYEEGLIGLLTLFTVLILWLVLIKNIEDLEGKKMLSVIFSMTVTHMIFVPTLNSPVLSYLFFSFIGIASAYSKSKIIKNIYSHKRSRILPVP